MIYELFRQFINDGFVKNKEKEVIIMARRKLGASVIILFIAAITLISGTYAWFLVGGFASLFDIGFDVIEAQGGLLLQGSAGTAEEGSTDWGSVLGRVDFTEKSFTVGPDSFLSVTVVGGEGYIDGEVCKKGESFFIPADSGEIVMRGDEELEFITVKIPGIE